MSGVQLGGLDVPAGAGRRRDAGIGVMVITDDPADVLVAPNLGSCLGVAAFDPQSRVAGLIHCLLPLSQADPERAKGHPELYVDTGVAALLDALIARGAAKRRILIYAAGGSAINDTNRTFDIGQRNITVLRKLLWKNNLLLKASDFGGECSRTVALFAASGDVHMKKDGAWQKL